METATENGSIETVKLPKSRRTTDASINKMVDLPEFSPQLATFQIRGISPLIVHNWSHKAIRQMLDKQTKKAAKAREAKNPFEDFKSSLYPVLDQPGKFGVPAPAFKACAVTAANDVQLKMTECRRAFHVKHYTVRIDGEPITTPITEEDKEYRKELAPYHKLGISMRMDVVRLETGVADLRFRAWWPVWKCQLEVEFNAALISLDILASLLRAGGYGCGICEWRPSAPKCRSGEYGRFEMV